MDRLLQLFSEFSAFLLRRIDRNRRVLVAWEVALADKRAFHSYCKHPDLAHDRPANGGRDFRVHNRFRGKKASTGVTGQQDLLL